MPISVAVSRELQAVLTAMRQVDKETQARIRRETRDMIGPAWTRAVAEHADTRLEQRVLAQTARVTVSNQNVTLKAATVGRRLSGGLDPKSQWHAVEFGADQDAITPYEATSRKGKRYTVSRRHTSRQLRPRRKGGYVVFNAEAEVVPRLAALWAQTWARALHEAFEAA